MTRGLIIGGLALILAACGGSGSDNTFEDEVMAPSAAPAESMTIAEFQDVARERGVPEDRLETDGAEPGMEQYIAYSHRLGVALPKGGVEAMMETHVEACQDAGTNTCIVVNSNIRSEEVDYAYGNVSIRATPDWIEGFLGEIDGETEAAGGEITQRSTMAEDLTRAIVDTGARLEAQKTLQMRLLGLLEGREGELGDLLQIERELARVTGDIESIEAQLKTLRLRVSMSDLTLSYQTKVPAFSAARENPLGRAFSDFFYNLSGAIAAVITAFAVGLPWLALIGLFLWIWLKLIWPRIRGQKKPKKTEQPSE